MDKNQTTKLQEKIVNLAKKYAELEVNSACPWWNHQEKFKKPVDDLRKLK